jgi:hypothetical protein
MKMHMISDEELDLLREGNRDGSIYWALAAGGVGIGLAQNLIGAGYSVYTNAPPDLTQFGLGLCATILLSSSVACFVSSRHVGSSVNALVEAVKNRSDKHPADEPDLQSEAVDASSA